MKKPELDPLDAIGYYCLLLIVFVCWLAGHVLHEGKLLETAIGEWQAPANHAQPVIPKP